MDGYLVLSPRSLSPTLCHGDNEPSQTVSTVITYLHPVELVHCCLCLPGVWPPTHIYVCSMYTHHILGSHTDSRRLVVSIRKETIEGKKELKQRAACYVPWILEKELWVVQLPPP